MSSVASSSRQGIHRSLTPRGNLTISNQPHKAELRRVKWAYLEERKICRSIGNTPKDPKSRMMTLMYPLPPLHRVLQPDKVLNFAPVSGTLSHCFCSCFADFLVSLFVTRPCLCPVLPLLLFPMSVFLIPDPPECRPGAVLSCKGLCCHSCLLFSDVLGPPLYISHFPEGTDGL